MVMKKIMVLVFFLVISLGYSQDWKTNFTRKKKKLLAKASQ
jgi:hypothetical protein